VAHAQEGQNPARQEPTAVRIRISFNDLTPTATLYDNPSARDFASMLPLDLKIEDYGKNEKIVFLPRKLTEGGVQWPQSPPPTPARRYSFRYLRRR
jgi:hypothetical protein